MSDDPWGVDTPPALRGTVPPLPAHLAALADLAARGERRFLEQGEPWPSWSAADLPEVQALAAEGWRLAPGDPLSSCLPAVWPAEHRCWVPDRLPRISEAAGDGRRWLQPWDEDDVDDDEALLEGAAEECGLPPPPRGRLWLLRSPWPTLGLEVVLCLIGHRRAERHLDHEVRGVTEAARELLTWSEEEVWSWWHGPEARAALAWRRIGRVGEDVAGLIAAALDPDLTTRLLAPVGEGGAGLTEAQAVAWAEAIHEEGAGAAESILAWRALGLPSDPPRDYPASEVLLSTPEEIGAWLSANFTLEEVGAWRGGDLGLALRWREHGFTAAQARELLAADWTVTPEEALAFDAAGIEPRGRRAWLEAGFSAAEARAWTDLDVLPQEARVWRSVGKGPEEAGRHRSEGGGALPPDVHVGWFGYGSARGQRVYGVSDPPGTRGSVAAEAERRPPRS